MATPRKPGRAGDNAAAAAADKTAMPTAVIAAADAVPAITERAGSMLETNGGGSIEKVAGFNNLRPMTAGFNTTRVSGPTALASVPDGGFFSVAPGALEPAPLIASSYGAAGKPEDVIGIDDRVLVSDTSATPWRCICHLEITYNTGQVGFGTGWFAGERTVITAAHCLYHRSPVRYATQVRVIPGRNGTLAPYGYVVASEFTWNKKWETSPTDIEAAPYDYGAIFINEKINDAPFGERIGYFGMRSYDADAKKRLLDMAIVNNAGYPHEAMKRYGTMWFNAGRVHVNNTPSSDERFLDYMVDTTGGDSGSPVFVLDSTRNQRYVVAIHTTGNFVNRGVRITAEVYATILDWLK
jgi:V8-like Glu-specific endopeptidase